MKESPTNWPHSPNLIEDSGLACASRIDTTGMQGEFVDDDRHVGEPFAKERRKHLVIDKWRTRVEREKERVRGFRAKRPENYRKGLQLKIELGGNTESTAPLAREVVTKLSESDLQPLGEGLQRQ